MDDALLDASAMSLARRIRTREVSPVEVVTTHIRRIEAVNGAINAVIAERFDRALDEAKAAEARVMRSQPDELPPLLGLPYTTKAYIGAVGMPLDAGIWSRRNVVAERNAEVVERLTRAGAILVGITNVPEGGLWMETYNAIHGRTVNPWDATRAAGGSSGGEGAIVASGGVAFGLGSDVGGSIRIPAAFCGTVGHKPSGRLIPNTGFWPPAEGRPLSAYLVCGPLCRRVEDVMPILRVLAGPDGVDTVVQPMPLHEPSEVDLRHVTVYPLERNGLAGLSDDYRRALVDATEVLRDRGAKVGRLDPSMLRQAFPIWGAMMNDGGGPSYDEVIGNGVSVRAGREFVRLLLGRSRHTLPALATIGIERLMARMPGSQTALVARGRELATRLERELGPNGVIVHPPYSRPAPRHRWPLLTPFDFTYTGLWNVLEFPSTVVPTGFSGEGLPLAVQVIAGRGRDHLTLAVAQALEDRHGGWRRANPTGRVRPVRATSSASFGPDRVGR